MEEIINNLDFTSYIIDENNTGVRIDKALASLNPSLSRTQIQLLIDEGYVTCNDKNVKASLKVFVNDEVKLYEKSFNTGFNRFYRTSGIRCCKKT